MFCEVLLFNFIKTFSNLFENINFLLNTYKNSQLIATAKHYSLLRLKISEFVFYEFTEEVTLN